MKARFYGLGRVQRQSLATLITSENVTQFYTLRQSLSLIFNYRPQEEFRTKGGKTMANVWNDTVGTKEYEKNLNRVRNIAKEKGYVLNPDEERMQKVVGLMTMNYNEFNKYYCPCKQSHPLNPQKDILCPCPVLDEEVKKDGHCFCRLFYRNESTP